MIYYRCFVNPSKKRAEIPTHILLSDGEYYRVEGIRSRSFVARKKVRRVTVYAPSITKGMMRRAIRGSGVERVIYDNQW